MRNKIRLIFCIGFNLLLYKEYHTSYVIQPLMGRIKASMAEVFKVKNSGPPF